MIVSEISTQVRERIPVSEIHGEDYVSTDNMRPNFCGIEPSLSVPPTGTVTAYKAGDILLSNIRPYFRKTWLATHDGGCNADVLCIRVKSPQCIPKYLYYLFTTDSFVNDYLKSCKGAKMPRGDVNRLLAFEFHLPDLPTQLRIAGIIGCIIHCLLRSHQEVFAHHQEADGAIYILRVHPLLSGKLQRQVVYCVVRWSTPPQNVSSHGRATSQ